MIARYAGASLGLLAFATAVFAGLYVGNPLTVTLSRGILALFVFCLIGIGLGGIAQYVLSEHERDRRAEIRRKYQEEDPPETKSPVAESGVSTSVAESTSA